MQREEMVFLRKLMSCLFYVKLRLLLLSSPTEANFMSSVAVLGMLFLFVFPYVYVFSFCFCLCLCSCLCFCFCLCLCLYRIHEIWEYTTWSDELLLIIFFISVDLINFMWYFSSFFIYIFLEGFFNNYFGFKYLI